MNMIGPLAVPPPISRLNQTGIIVLFGSEAQFTGQTLTMVKSTIEQYLNAIDAIRRRHEWPGIEIKMSLGKHTSTLE